jgi:hypothetical protein
VNVCPNGRWVSIREEVYKLPCRSRKCDVCGALWLMDQRVRAVAAAGEVDGDVGLLTITGPGRAWFDLCTRATGWNPRASVRWWNATARKRWRRLHQAASRSARQWAREHGVRWRLLYRVWEYQKRGVLHLHLVVPMGSYVERTASRRYFRALCDLSADHDFGWCGGGDKNERLGSMRYPTVVRFPRGKAANYVAKYVANNGTGKETMRDTAKRTATRGSVLYVDPTLTRASGVTMKSLQARRRIWSRYPWARDSEAGWHAACVVDSVQRGRAPLTPRAVIALRRAALRTRCERWVDPSTGETGRRTAAPLPRACDRNMVPRPGDGRDLRAVLASVWVGVSAFGDLGPWRATAEVQPG